MTVKDVVVPVVLLLDVVVLVVVLTVALLNLYTSLTRDLSEGPGSDGYGLMR